MSENTATSQPKAKPLTVIVQSASGSEVVVSVDDLGKAKEQIRGEIARSGVPENQQILVHGSKVLFNDVEFEEDEFTLTELLSNLGDDTTTMSLSLVTRDPIVAEWLENVRSWDCQSLEEAPAIVRNSEEVLLSAARRGFIDDVFEHANVELLADKTFMHKVVKMSGECLKYAAEDLRADEEIVFEAVKQCGRSMEYAAPSLKNDPSFVAKAVEAGGNALGYINRALITRELVVAAVRSEGSAFGWAVDFYGDREIALEAVRRDGQVLEFASDELKADREVVGVAAKSSARALEDAGEALKNDKDFLWSCVKANPGAIAYVGAVVTEDDQLMREFADGVNGKWGKVARECPYLQYASSALRSDKEYVLMAVKYLYHCIEFVSEELKSDRDVWLECLNDGDGGCCWGQCPESLKEDWEFAVECCRIPNFSPDEFPFFPHDDLEAEVSKRGGPGSLGSDDRCYSH